MKIIKKILLAIVFLIVLVLVVALFVKREYSVERDITINKPQQDVFNYIKFVKNQDNYSKWAMADPAMRKEYKGTDGTVGFVSAWDSDSSHVGKGEQEITKITDNELDMDLRFIKPFKGSEDAAMKAEAIDSNQTKVKWIFHSKMNYPMNVMLLCMNMDKMVGNDLSTGLTNLKAILEK